MVSGTNTDGDGPRDQTPPDEPPKKPPNWIQFKDLPGGGEDMVLFGAIHIHRRDRWERDIDIDPQEGI